MLLWPFPRMSCEWKFLRILHDLSYEFLVWLKENFASVYKSFISVEELHRTVFIFFFPLSFWDAWGAWVWWILSKRFSIMLDQLFLRSLARRNWLFSELFCLSILLALYCRLLHHLSTPYKIYGKQKENLETVIHVVSYVQESTFFPFCSIFICFSNFFPQGFVFERGRTGVASSWPALDTSVFLYFFKWHHGWGREREADCVFLSAWIINFGNITRDYRQYMTKIYGYKRLSIRNVRFKWCFPFLSF